MDKILDQYECYSYAENVIISAEYETQGNWCHEYGKLKAKVDTIQKFQKHLVGEDLETLNLKELQQLEQQLESSLKHIRSRKSQLMHESIQSFNGRSLQEENKVLQKEHCSFMQLVEKQKAQQQQVKLGQTQQQTSSSSTSLMMKEGAPTTNIRRDGGGGSSTAAARIGLPPWMLVHLSG
ncbi:hypothetical protein BS78_K070900 [Paspalum vaginatum]|uniref:K-box domain-containing protein n=1 Tax=Paspalum vaginatum TaxID=158149 RepID=A0A9W8CGK4_9POAL|nr:hypothetical protein BS78_K070900 [Paspalum vaginatum]